MAKYFLVGFEFWDLRNFASNQSKNSPNHRAINWLKYTISFAELIEKFVKSSRHKFWQIKKSISKTLALKMANKISNGPIYESQTVEGVTLYETQDMTIQFKNNGSILYEFTMLRAIGVSRQTLLFFSKNDQLCDYFYWD